MAMKLVKTMAKPRPVTARPPRRLAGPSARALAARPAMERARAKMVVRRRPRISASLAPGAEAAAMGIMRLRGIQPSMTAESPSSRSMTGRPTFKPVKPRLPMRLEVMAAPRIRRRLRSVTASESGATGGGEGISGGEAEAGQGRGLVGKEIQALVLIQDLKEAA